MNKMTATKHDNSINKILTAMGIHDIKRALPPKDKRSNLCVFTVKKDVRK